jgi:acetyl esterase/lipase
VASLQAKALNVVFRHWFKPSFQRGHTVESLRRLSQRLEWFAGRPPRGTQTKPVDLGSCEGEWISNPRSGPRPTILYLPGGGFVLRTPKVHRALVGRVCREAQADALLTFYRLAPEDPFPAGLDDCVAAYERLLEDGIAPESIVIGGDSAGGCLVLATLMALRDSGIPLPAGGFTMSAVTDLRIHVEGTRTTNDGVDPMLSFNQSAEWHRLYVSHQEERLSDPGVSPMLGDFAGLPPLLMQASTIEVLLDDTRLVAEHAKDAGVECCVQLFPGLSHVWQIVPQLPESRQALRNIGAFVRETTSIREEVV